MSGLMTRASVAVLVCLFGCASMTQQGTQRLAANVNDALTVAKPLLGDDADAYVAAVQAVIAAVSDGDGQFGYDDAFRAIESLEPEALAALIANGQDPAQAAAIMALARIALRELQAALEQPPQEEEPVGPTDPTSLPAG